MSATAGPSSSTTVNDEDEPVSRPTTILLLRLLHTMAMASLASNSMEQEILASAPASLEEVREDDPRETEARGQDDNTWRLDLNGNPSRRTPRELISGGGRVLQPFTILPSNMGSSDRERLQSEVFRESWRLPSMTIDEYLAEEQRRGNIITGGGYVISSHREMHLNDILTPVIDKPRTMLQQKVSCWN